MSGRKQPVSCVAACLVGTRTRTRRRTGMLLSLQLLLLLLLMPMLLLSIIRPTAAFFPSSQRVRVRVQTFVSSSSSSSQHQQQQQQQQRVVYQKVVRPPPNLPSPTLFLASLVQYLQEEFQLPDRLPMVYESCITEQTEQNDSNDGDYTILQWDSPLSPAAAETCLQVQVVALYTDSSADDNDNNNSNMESKNKIKTPSVTTASMAMVVVGKQSKIMSSQPQTSNMPTLLQNLFADSEQQILKALDRGLEDYMQGRVGVTEHGSRTGSDGSSSSSSSKKGKSSFAENEQALWTEVLTDGNDNNESMISSNRKEASKDVVNSQNAVDAEVVATKTPSNEYIDPNDPRSDKNVRTSKRTKDPADVNNSNNIKNENADKPMVLDYAVQQAKKAVAARRRKNSLPTTASDIEDITTNSEDFAVQAAKKAAQKRKAVQATNKVASTAKRRQNGTEIASSSLEVTKLNDRKAGDWRNQLNLQSIRPPSLNPRLAGMQRAFMQTISTPSDFLQQKKITRSDQQSKSTKVKSDQPSSSEQSTSDTKSSLLNATNDNRQRKLNLNVRKDEKEPLTSSRSTVSVDEKDDMTDREEKERIKVAQEALSEIASQGKDMSPEELLSDVLKFGEKKDKESQAGEGFVSGAFEKAKELLREQKRQREERLKRQVVDKVTQDVQNLASSDVFSTPKAELKEFSPEEELRRMFEAGERLADGRITKVSSPYESKETSVLSNKITGTEEVESLIAAEKSVSSYARILDDELAELEVRINKTPEEDTDGAKKNPVFDIFSGPEVYDPNVDPETAVNWPGAIPGTSQIRLPKQLDEAVRQARFAAEVVMNLREETQEDEKGDISVRCFVGEREILPDQLENLRRVVKEAVDVGIIQDPLVRASESSRLQMLLDELWNQSDERIREITLNYKDLLLSDNFVSLIKERLTRMADRDLEALRRDDTSLEERHSRERELLGQIVAYAQLLFKETRALGAELEAQQLEVIRSICKVAMDPSHKTEEDTAIALSDAVRDMRPLFDDAFVAYLKYAVAEEEGRLARAGALDDPQKNQWLFVLKIVQQGVYRELEKGISRYIDHIWYVLRLETPEERRLLLRKLIDVMPTLDVRPFMQVVDSIVGSLGDSVRGQFDGYTELGEMTNKLLQLKKDVHSLLPEERVAAMSREADEWAAKQKERLLEQRNLTKKRLEAARDTEHFDDEMEALGRRGELERFD